MKIRFAFCFASFLICPMLWANISLNQTILIFDTDQERRQDVEVYNHGDQPVFINVDVFEILSPGLERQVRNKISDPRKAGLLVTPKRTAMAAGGRQLVRFVRLDRDQHLAADRVYRVTVTPVLGDLKSEVSAVKVVVAYEVLVILRPRDPNPKLISRRIGEWLEFENQGNSNVLLRKGVQCQTKLSGLDCLQLPGKRLYAGNKWRVKAPLDAPVKYEYAIGFDNFEKEFQ